MKALVALLAGILFGVGLAMSGMTDTAKVLGFLDITGAWDPDLMFVMGGAVAVTLACFPLILKRVGPIFGDTFHVPTNRIIDRRLLTGAALFGVGWGIYGYCPGPALSALVYADMKTLIFVLAMLAGMALANRVPAKA
jgi:uncharacterized membrane protein YedE/YeeE